MCSLWYGIFQQVNSLTSTQPAELMMLSAKDEARVDAALATGNEDDILAKSEFTSTLKGKCVTMKRNTITTMNHPTVHISFLGRARSLSMYMYLSKSYCITPRMCSISRHIQSANFYNVLTMVWCGWFRYQHYTTSNELPAWNRVVKWRSKLPCEVAQSHAHSQPS